MTKTHIKRLEKLAAFLDKLPRKKFDLKELVSARRGKCIAVACAIGWMPVVFPGEIYQNDCDIMIAQEFMDLSYEEAHRLFVSSEDSDLGVLSASATPKQVAREIRKFIKEKSAATKGAK